MEAGHPIEKGDVILFEYKYMEAHFQSVNLYWKAFIVLSLNVYLKSEINDTTVHCSTYSNRLCLEYRV